MRLVYVPALLKHMKYFHVAKSLKLLHDTYYLSVKSLPETAVNTKYSSQCVNITITSLSEYSAITFPAGKLHHHQAHHQQAHHHQAHHQQAHHQQVHHQQCQGHWYQLDACWQITHRVCLLSFSLSYTAAVPYIFNITSTVPVALLTNQL